jgi:hypothetical protein
VRAPWRLAYAYAKASGSLSRGFLGTGASSLSQARDLRSLVRLVYPGPPPELPEAALVADAEERLGPRMRERTGKVLALSGRDTLRILKAAYLPAEADRAKTFVRASLRKEKRPSGIGLEAAYSGVDEKAYPDLERMFASSAFPWIPAAAKAGWGFREENRLDREALTAAWNVIRGIIGRDGRILRKLFVREAKLRNAVWALRLSINFKARAEEIEPLLFRADGVDFTQEALLGTSFPPDSRPSFASWKFSMLVEQESGGEFFMADPALAEKRAEALVRRSIKSAFRAAGPSVAALYCYLRLASIESDAIRSAFEVLRLGQDAFEPSSAREARQ